MKTERELLEAAAKAAGIAIEWDGDLPIPFGSDVAWNPLTDDGDALRLAVKLKLKITIGNAIVMVESRWPTPDAGERFDSDDEAATATRRAIVCAAAAMAG